MNASFYSLGEWPGWGTGTGFGIALSSIPDLPENLLLGEEWEFASSPQNSALVT
jgi:hypothetical protein